MADYTMASITEEIAAHLKKELDEPFKHSLATKVDAWRGTLLRRTLKENPNERVHFRQTLWVPMEKVSAVPGCIDPIAPVCPIMRSTMKLPSAVRAGSILFDFVGSADGNTSFSRVIPGTDWIMRQGKYSTDRISYERVNSYLEVYNATGIPLVRVDGVFDKPSEVVKFNCTSEDGCDEWEVEYPVSSDIKQAIVECILKVDFGQPVAPANKEVQVTPQMQEHAPDGR